MMKRPPGAPPPPSAGPIAVRPAGAADAHALSKLLASAFPEQVWDGARVHKELLDAADVAVTYVIDEGGRPVATASVRYVERFPDSGYVHWVAVDPRHRGQRLGTVVMETVIRRFLADGRESAILETDDVRLPAIASYLGQGFIPHYSDVDHEDRWSAVFSHLARSRRAARNK
ncbi:MAG: GNAT family N-acetyltransferase [Devosia nanyangense]|uniref:GNAT family N-acetyltransferase n=1 Tax=Devosia nanyangense TaxID=1228055 RepID=A0A933L2N1_9HYPH|nr:GNAT family N-acetyltransferase [Devosia nanyangense]